MFGKKKNDEDENEESEELEFGEDEEYDDAPAPKAKPQGVSVRKPMPKQEAREDVPQPTQLAKRQKEIVYVVNEIPKQDVRSAQMNDGSIASFITTEEALSEMYADIKLLKKALLQS